MIFSNTFKTTIEAWNWGTGIINNHGIDVLSEDNELTREIRNMVIEITSPSVGWPIPNSGWNLTGLDNYAEQFLDFSEDPKGFDYRYGQRMGTQINKIIEMLKNHPTSRRAVVQLWMSQIDLFGNKHKPCNIIGDFKLRNNKLDYCVIFRSHDFGRAYPANIYGLSKLLHYVASEIDVPPGSIITHSISAHIYKI